MSAYQTKNLFSPITQRVIIVNSPAFKSLTRDTTFTYDKEKNILVPDNKTNYIFNEYLGRWFHKDYKLKPVHKPPTEKEKEKLKKAYETFDRISKELSPAPMKFSKVKPERKVAFMETTTMESKPKTYDIDDKDSYNVFRANRDSKIRADRIKNQPQPFTWSSERQYKNFQNIIKSPEYKDIIELLNETNDKLYSDYNNTKEIKYIKDSKESLLKLFKNFENINSGIKLEEAVKSYNTIFNTFKWFQTLNKKKEPSPLPKIQQFSTAWYFINNYDEILNRYGRTMPLYYA